MVKDYINGLPPQSATLIVYYVDVKSDCEIKSTQY